MENAKKFFEEVIMTDEAKKLISSIEQPKTPEDFPRAYSKIATELGIELSAEEITAYFDKKLKGSITSSEIDDDEMAQFTGGSKQTCASTYTDRENCWWSDGCDYYMNIYSLYRCSWSSEGACAAFSVDDNAPSAPNNAVLKST